MILDAYRAFEKLSEHPRIDNDRVSITGWSLERGYFVFCMATSKNAINKRLKFNHTLHIIPLALLNLEI